MESTMDSRSVGVFNELPVSGEELNSTVLSVPEISAIPKTSEGISTKAAPSWCSAKDFIDILGILSIPGPLNVTDHLQPDYFIARGGQFSVYENNLAFWNPSRPYGHPVVVKTCHITLDADQVLDLTSEDTKKQIHDMYLEVLALSHSHLRRHRNIVKLLGWAHELDYNTMPLLVMELAIGDLSTFLPRPESHDWNIKHHLCLDMSAGLDALHQYGIIHADFKPQNVLIFQEPNDRVPFIAKLSDFGFSTIDVKENSNNAISITGWTEGWQAPEIDHYRDTRTPITTENYRKADIYSFGLVVWSVFCVIGRPPSVTANSNAATSAISMFKAIIGIPNSLRQTCCLALERILCYDPVTRPESVGSLFCDNSDCYRLWKSDCHAQAVAEADDAYLPTTPRNELVAHKWALDDISQFRLEGIQQRFNKSPSSMSSNDLFVSFLEGTDWSVGEDVTFTSVHIQMLLASAENGFTPAQAVINRVIRSYNIEWPLEYAKKRLCWLSRGTKAGCLIAKSDLMKIDSGLAQNATAAFCKEGAFRKHYSTQQDGDERVEIGNRNMSVPSYQIQNHRNSTTSFGPDPKLASSSIGQETDAFVEIHPISKAKIDLRNSEMLYMACLAGCSKDVRQLCHDGSNAGFFGKPNEAPCLHWLFNFLPEEMSEIATLLIRSGADVNFHLKTKTPVPRFFFPFTWPAGTALHWAVGASNTSAVTVLLQHGIDCRSRNEVDPYMYDIDTRYLSNGSVTTSGDMFSVPPEPPEGLTALDIAVANYDWAILETIIAAGCKETGICDSDEEGYTPFHRLEHNWIGRTLSGSRFWHGAFWGSRSERYDKILRTIKTLQVMGGDINRLTSPSESNPRKQRCDRPGSLTPLMLAVRKVDIDAARALLACGADPNIRNNIGFNALSQLPEAKSPSVSFRELGPLVELLLTMGAEPSIPSSIMEWCPLASAIESKCLEVISLILDAGADPSMKQRKLGIIAVLIESHTINKHAWTEGSPQALEAQDDELAKWILKNLLGKRKTTEVMENVDPYGGSLLHYAVHSGLPKVVEVLIQDGAKVDVCRAPIISGDREINQYAQYMLDGIPLDVAMRRRSDVLAQIKGQFFINRMSPTNYRYKLSIFDKIAKILTKAAEKTPHSG